METDTPSPAPKLSHPTTKNEPSPEMRDRVQREFDNTKISIDIPAEIINRVIDTTVVCPDDTECPKCEGSSLTKRLVTSKAKIYTLDSILTGVTVFTLV